MSRPRVSPYETIVVYATSAPVPEVENMLATVRAILKGRNGDPAPRKRKAKTQAELPLESATK